MKKQIQTIATGSAHSFSEGFDKEIFETPKLKLVTKKSKKKNK